MRIRKQKITVDLNDLLGSLTSFRRIADQVAGLESRVDSNNSGHKEFVYNFYDTLFSIYFPIRHGYSTGGIGHVWDKKTGKALGSFQSWHSLNEIVMNWHYHQRLMCAGLCNRFITEREIENTLYVGSYCVDCWPAVAYQKAGESC